jgi:hypothetical protein
MYTFYNQKEISEEQASALCTSLKYQPHKSVLIKLLNIRSTLSQIFFNFRNICVSVAVFRHILQNILQYMYNESPRHLHIYYGN